MLVTYHQDEARAFLGHRQHGIGVPNGISCFATKIAGLAEARQEYLFLQTDISNAFGMVHRDAVQQSLGECSASLAACSRAWLSREATGYVQVPGQQRHRITSSRGLQQGDPLSALAFSIVMEHAMRDLEHTLRRQSIDLDFDNLALAYIDDTVLCMPQHAAEAVIVAWQAALEK
eukprot:6481375-Amphidinium_carterae.1